MCAFESVSHSETILSMREPLRGVCSMRYNACHPMTPRQCNLPSAQGSTLPLAHTLASSTHVLATQAGSAAGDTVEVVGIEQAGLPSWTLHSSPGGQQIGKTQLGGCLNTAAVTVPAPAPAAAAAMHMHMAQLVHRLHRVCKAIWPNPRRFTA